MASLRAVVKVKHGVGSGGGGLGKWCGLGFDVVGRVDVGGVSVGFDLGYYYVGGKVDVDGRVDVYGVVVGRVVVQADNPVILCRQNQQSIIRGGGGWRVW